MPGRRFLAVKTKEEKMSDLKPDMKKDLPQFPSLWERLMAGVKARGRYVIVPISEIKVGERARKDTGDLSELVASIEQIGLLHPIIITPDKTLISGLRRLEALRALGRTEAPAIIATNLASAHQLLLAERDENICRKDLTPSEAVEIARKLEPYERAEAEKRKRASMVSSGRPPGGAKFSPPEKGRTRERVARAVGLSHTTLAKARAVVEASERDPQAFERIREEMDRTGKVHRAYRKLKEIQKEVPDREVGQPWLQGVGSFNYRSFREDGKMLEDGSVDMILADPSWDENWRELYRDMALFAARVLRPGGICMVSCDNAHLPEVMAIMGKELQYVWTCIGFHRGKHRDNAEGGFQSLWKPFLVYAKRPLEIRWKKVRDRVSLARMKNLDNWSRRMEWSRYYIQALCPQRGCFVDLTFNDGVATAAADTLVVNYVSFEVSQTDLPPSMKGLLGLCPWENLDDVEEP